MADDLDLLAGEWTVKVQGWVWTYTFGPKGALSWQDTRGPDSGTGRWAADGKAVYLTWSSGVKESWTRPLKASSDKTWYSSSYFNGKYSIEKKGGAGGEAIVLVKPPDVRQTNLYCWAAGASSWMQAKGRAKRTVDQLKIDYGGYLNPDGSLPEGDSEDPDALKGGLKAVFGKMGIQVVSVAVKDLTFAYFRNMLATKGHFLLMAQYGGSMGHTYVVYGVGVPTSGHFSVLDPLHGYLNIKIGDLRGSSAYVGWAS